MGRQFLFKEFGIIPKIAWHVDEFGHSSVNAKLFAELGYEALFFARADYQDKIKRRAEKNMEFIWKPKYEGDVSALT